MLVEKVFPDGADDDEGEEEHEEEDAKVSVVS